VKAADYTYFEGITFRNADIAIWSGTQFAIGSKGLTVKRCRFENVGAGIFTNYSAPATTTSPTTGSSAGRSQSRDRMGPARSGSRFNGVEGQKFPPR
jgi:hypothetical protein